MIAIAQHDITVLGCNVRTKRNSRGRTDRHIAQGEQLAVKSQFVCATGAYHGDTIYVLERNGETLRVPARDVTIDGVSQ